MRLPRPVLALLVVALATAFGVMAPGGASASRDREAELRDDARARRLPGTRMRVSITARDADLAGAVGPDVAPPPGRIDPSAPAVAVIADPAPPSPPRAAAPPPRRRSRSPPEA